MPLDLLPKGRKSSNFVAILMKRTRLLNFKEDMFQQLLCHRQFADGITMMNNITGKSGCESRI